MLYGILWGIRENFTLPAIFLKKNWKKVGWVKILSGNHDNAVILSFSASLILIDLYELRKSKKNDGVICLPSLHTYQPFGRVYKTHCTYRLPCYMTQWKTLTQQFKNWNKYSDQRFVEVSETYITSRFMRKKRLIWQCFYMC